MLKKPHRKAPHHRIGQGVAELLGGSRIFYGTKRGGQEVDNGFSCETLERTHLYRLAKRKNSRAPTPILQAFRRNRELLLHSALMLRRALE
jgi:hypothetical protein